MHDLQKLIIKRLILQNKQKYATLTTDYDFEDNIVFHLKQLLKNHLISKRGDFYYLTKKGLEFSSQFDLDTLEDKKYKTLYIGFVCNFGDQFLIRKHIAENDTFFKLPGGKPFFGEQLSEALVRLFTRDTGTVVSPQRFTFHDLQLKTQTTKDRKVLFDNVLMNYTISLQTEEYKNAILREGNIWVEYTAISSLSELYPEVEIAILQRTDEVLNEYTLSSNYHLNEEDT